MRRRQWRRHYGLPDHAPRELWDWKIIDENGREVWAKDLAARYRSELMRRADGDWTLEV